MNFLDVRTVIFINVITNCLCTFVIAILWLQNRKRFEGTSFWVVDFCFQTTALFLIILRGSIPDWMSMVLANTLAIAGALLGYMGLERFLGKKSTQVYNYVLIAAFACIHTYFVFLQPKLIARNINLSVGLFIICAQCVWLMLRRVPPGMRKMSQGTGIVFGGFCIASLFRIFALTLFHQPDNDFFKSGLYDMIVIISYQLLLILLSYSLTLMVNRRLLMEIHTQEEKFSKAFHSSPYAITLTRLSDGHILEINEGFVNITGYPYDEVIGKTTIDLRLWENDEDRAAVVDELSRNNRVRDAEYQFKNKSGETIIGLFSAEIIMINDSPWVLSVIIDITERKLAEREREKLYRELQVALSKVKKLSGMLPICSHCKKIRDDKGYWNKIEAYIQKHSDAEFSHGVCPECAKKYYPDMNLYGDEQTQG